MGRVDLKSSSKRAQTSHFTSLFLRCYCEKEGGAGHRAYDAVGVRREKMLPDWAKPLEIFGRMEKENLRPKMPKHEVGSSG